MNFNNNKEKGNAGLAMAIAYFGANGYIVSLPLNDTQDYDLLVDINNNLLRVQAKATSFKKNGFYVVDLKSAGGTSGKIYKRVSDTNIDLLFILCENKDMYIIPKEIFKEYRSTITLNESKETYKVSH